MQSYESLKGKTAIVTGSSSGIGSAVARTLAASGASVVVNYFRNEPGATSTLGAIQKAGGAAIAWKADVRSSAECRGLVAEAERIFGPVDILVNNAGSLVERQRILELSEAHWDDVMDLNLKSAYLCVQAVAKSMIGRKSGCIVNVSSIAAHNGGGPGAGPYAAAKAGLIALSKNLARELAPHGVRVNTVSPGVVDTRFHEQFSTPEAMKNFVASIPMGRVGTPEDVAGVVAFLCSSAAGYLCGETIEVNGGLLMR